MVKEEIKTDKSLKPVGPYSQGVRGGDFVFVSGQVGVDPRTGETPESAAEQTRLALESVRAILEASGATMDDVVKVTVFLKDMGEYEEMNKVYSTFFKTPFPTRSTVGIKSLARDYWRVEIEAIACLSGSPRP